MIFNFTENIQFSTRLFLENSLLEIINETKLRLKVPQKYRDGCEKGLPKNDKGSLQIKKCHKK